MSQLGKCVDRESAMRHDSSVLTDAIRPCHDAFPPPNIGHGIKSFLGIGKATVPSLVAYCVVVLPFPPSCVFPRYFIGFCRLPAFGMVFAQIPSPHQPHALWTCRCAHEAQYVIKPRIFTIHI